MYRRCVRVSRRVLATCAALYAAAQVLFLVNLRYPRLLSFDEFHYVPAARELARLRPDPNTEHPPLGKELIAVGLEMAGDDALGWRGMSTVFGALTVVGLYVWALALFGDERLALWTALLTLVDQLVYVQARIAMLDTFMFAFAVWAWAAFAAGCRDDLEPPARRRLLSLAGLMIGLSCACKWSAAPVWVAMAAIAAGLRRLSAREWILAFCVLPLAAYLLPFVPLLFVAVGAHSPLELWRMQGRIWNGQLRVGGAHAYMSGWLTWPLMLRPVWYAFDPDGAGGARGVVLLGNPLVLWPGLAALACCSWAWLKGKDRGAFLILAAYGAFYLPWAVIPRKLTFYYYYYPAGVTSSLALACALRRRPRLRWAYLAAAAAVFAYFFPVLSATRIDPSHLRRWAWFSSWL